jgi:hypothetical protein
MVPIFAQVGAEPKTGVSFRLPLEIGSRLAAESRERRVGSNGLSPARVPLILGWSMVRRESLRQCRITAKHSSPSGTSVMSPDSWLVLAARVIPGRPDRIRIQPSHSGRCDRKRLPLRSESIRHYLTDTVTVLPLFDTRSCVLDATVAVLVSVLPEPAVT